MRVVYLLTQSTGGPVDLTVGLARTLAGEPDGPEVTILGPELHTSAGDPTPWWRHAPVTDMRDRGAMRTVGERIRALRPDVVHAQDRRAGLTLTTVGRTRAPLVWTYHGLPDGASRLFIEAGPWAARLEPRALAVLAGDAWVGRRATVTVAPSAAMARFLRTRLRLPARRVRHLPNGIAVPPRHAVRGPARRFVHVSAFSPQKDVARLVRAFARTASECPDVELVLAGDGPERPFAEQESLALGLSGRVRFLGYRRDVPAVLATGDAFVLASLSENLPLALLEAMGSGLACIASRVGGVEEIVRPGEGLLVPPGDTEALAGAMTRLATEPDLAPALGAAAADRVREAFSLERCATAHLHLYRTLVGAHPAGRP